MGISQSLKARVASRLHQPAGVPGGLEGGERGSGLRFAVVASRFNEVVTQRLVAGVYEGFRACGVADSAVDLVWVPGGFEVPWACKQMAGTHRYDAVVAVAAVIRGETDHYEHVCEALTSGVARVSLETNVPVLFGALTVSTLAQAMARAGGKRGNRGRDAAEAAVRMATLAQKLRS